MYLTCTSMACRMRIFCLFVLCTTWMRWNDDKRKYMQCTFHATHQNFKRNDCSRMCITICVCLCVCDSSTENATDPSNRHVRDMCLKAIAADIWHCQATVFASSWIYFFLLLLYFWCIFGQLWSCRTVRQRETSQVDEHTFLALLLLCCKDYSKWINKVAGPRCRKAVTFVKSITIKSFFFCVMHIYMRCMRCVSQSGTFMDDEL